MDHRDTSLRPTASVAEIAGIVRLLHDTRWGWQRAGVDALLAEHPEWKVHRDLPDSLAVGLAPGRHHGPELVFTPRAHRGPDFRKAEVALAYHRGASASELRQWRGEVVDALSAVGEPVAYRTSEHGTGLRWRQDDRVLQLLGSESRTWIAVHPAAVADRLDQRLLDAAGALAPLLHDGLAGTFDQEALERLAAANPGWELTVREGTVSPLLTAGPGGPELSVLRFGPGGFNHVGLYAYPQGATLADRRAAFHELYDAVRVVLGEPTTLGGGPSGSDVRWRSESRTLRLLGDRRGVALEGEPTGELEEQEFGTFEWGGPSSDGSSDFPTLPYTWQLHRGGPGEEAVTLPGGRLALSVPQLREGLEVLLTAWAEQLPVQVPGERAQFKIVNRRDRNRILGVSLEPSGAIQLVVPDRSGDPAEGERAMTAAGWQRHGKRWRAVFTDPDERAAAAAAELVIAELVARGVTDPERDLGAKDVRCSPWAYDRGFFQVTGLGIARH
ncbi:hypothetical protein [Kitasatospora camelliae]|uniref:Uncharacterized protein n=1 Tax=Kitasatospora camelliae TaxID=3156397 RepID=A0AAU8JVW0_9ACTN